MTVNLQYGSDAFKALDAKQFWDAYSEHAGVLNQPVLVRIDNSTYRISRTGNELTVSRQAHILNLFRTNHREAILRKLGTGHWLESIKWWLPRKPAQYRPVWHSVFRAHEKPA